MWLNNKLKGAFARKPRNCASERHLDPNDNQYPRMKFEMKQLAVSMYK